jgi:hypothetical protein
MLSVVMLNVIMQNVLAPYNYELMMSLLVIPMKLLSRGLWLSVRLAGLADGQMGIWAAKVFYRKGWNGLPGTNTLA